MPKHPSRSAPSASNCSLPDMLKTLITLVAMACATLNPAWAQDKRFVLATTTSTENSGLLDVLIEQFSATSGYSVDVVAVGTGQALEIGRRGDAAAILVHDRAGEESFVANGFGTDRRDVMYNDFILVGPADDPAGVLQTTEIGDAFNAIKDTEAIFVSRGDDSGTHRKEQRLWAAIGAEPSQFGAWYRETGSGMGNTLLTTVELDGYTMTDRSTWIKFNRKGNHILVLEGDPPLFNPYSSILVTHPSLDPVAAQGGKQWHEWLTSPEGQAAINAYRIDGQKLFFTDP